MTKRTKNDMARVHLCAQEFLSGHDVRVTVIDGAARRYAVTYAVADGRRMRAIADLTVFKGKCTITATKEV
jgi:hypothetical protein